MYYFAWVANGNTAFGVAHHIADADVFSFEITHQEGDFPALTLEVKNPRVGLLSDGREQWAWLSWKKPDNSVVPLFHGRLIGVPRDLGHGIITLEFTARPANYEQQKKALAATLRVPPTWDPIFVDPDELKLLDSDSVLDARPQLWHIGRTDKLVTVSHILIPEDGQIIIDQNVMLEESLNVSYGQEPIRHAHVEATISWNQFAKGVIDLTGKVVAAFGAVGSGSYHVSTYTGGGTTGLEATWPKFGDSIGAGWSVYESRTVLLSGTGTPESFIETKIDPANAVPEEGDITIEDWWATSFEGYDYWYQKAVDAWIAEQIAAGVRPARFYLWVLHPTFKVQYEATRQKKEVLSFDVLADIQNLITDDAPKITDIPVSSNAVTEPVDPGIPIGDASRRSYFNTARGKRSVDYLLCLVRARMLFAARAVEVSFEVPFEIGVGLSCRKGAVVTSGLLPGGQCEGKIIGYTLRLDDGALTANCTIGCSIGRGEPLPGTDPGVETYVSGYVVGYRYMAGADIGSIPGELTYKDFHVKPVDDEIDFGNMTQSTVIADTAASALLTFPAPGVADTTVTVGTRVYTLKAALTGAYQVKIGADADATARNLADAINATEGQEGLTYGLGTLANALAHATAQDGILRATANAAGPGGNSIGVSSTSVATWDTPHMTGGDHGLVVTGGVTEQAAILGQTYGSVKAAIIALNEHPTHVQLALKPVTGGPFETNVAITVSKLVVPKQIDLEAE